jgi:hypothetical protein
VPGHGARIRSRAALAVAVAAALGACGTEQGFAIRGVRVSVETDAAFARAPDFPQRLESTLEIALRYWGGSWDDLSGASIHLSSDASVACAGATGLGCWDGATLRVTTRDPSIGTFACVEETVLVHEVGHAVIGDPMHRDPRWMEFEPVEAALSGRTGYGAAGVVDCLLWPSVWRHPLGAP